MKHTWFGLLATVAAAVFLTPAVWAAPHGGGRGGHGGNAGHGSYGGGRGSYGGGRGYYGGGGYYGEGREHHGDWDRGRAWGYPGYYGNGFGAYVGAYPGYGDSYGGYPGYYGSYDYGPEPYSYAAPAGSYQSFYPPDLSAYDATVAPAAATSGDAVVNVRVPDANAKVWFQGTLTHQTGTDRSYQSPALQPGQSYTYDVRAQWDDNGKMVDQTRHVQVHAGDRMTLDFLAPAARETR